MVSHRLFVFIVVFKFYVIDQLADTGAIRKLRVGVMDHWDADLCPHAHFACKACGRVYDLLATKMTIPVPDGFHVEREEAFLYGTCVHCNKMN